MLGFFRKNWFHVIMWVGMLFYLVFAQYIYIHFFLRNGKPILSNGELPAKTDQIEIHVDLFEPTVYDGQYLYLLTGWAFSTIDLNTSPEEYERQVVLISNDVNYFFSLETYPRSDVQKAFLSLGMELTNVGFHSQIAPDVVKPGIYHIGIVFYDHKNDLTSYAVTNKYLLRTPNQFQLRNSSTFP